MEVQELRLYNLLQYENDIVPVVGLNLEKDANLSLVQIQKGTNKIPIDSQQLKPVRLTSEWLVKIRIQGKLPFRFQNPVRHAGVW